ncbi:amino acid ABC transporter permease [Bacillus sp. FJAT-42376]|uniref:amino acid ABC transporter permease n=1 Tax=Bacillus sp. FJAT-42376 TaxID=2014076 RepID=UPI000F4F7620|nr:amino acid ABC transporter permease [Bacillus sp. FJAT-42376]AZB42470.1 amino acid ABC transporter permease [Bacillus sp. FJAT-42376]
MLDFTILTDNLDVFLQGFGNTVKTSVIALIGSFILGIIIAVMRISPMKILNAIGTVYVEFIRNIPLILIAFIFFYGLPSLGLKLNGYQSGTVALMIYTAAFIAEAVRAGIQSVSAGQMEAARSSGLTYIQAMRYVILPQAIKIVIPPLGNQFINLVKNSSILGVIAGLDLMYFGDSVANKTYAIFDTYIFVAAFYLVLTIPLSLFVGYLERRLAVSG